MAAMKPELSDDSMEGDYVVNFASVETSAMSCVDRRMAQNSNMPNSFGVEGMWKKLPLFISSFAEPIGSGDKGSNPNHCSVKNISWVAKCRKRFEPNVGDLMKWTDNGMGFFREGKLREDVFAAFRIC